MLSEALQPFTLPWTSKTLGPGWSVTEAAPDPRKLMWVVKVPDCWKNGTPFRVAVTCPTSP
ncbi:uncharacterized protein sS8_1877 [Methylocaldum marinum]|uniref:Uncharacterized protein n=1 Tax=Methylocaldum marinum TaxID=1432792 RepID=A0A250KS95_9GAMM|nr:uncharacterized protein sS8_1877 [Methylocaldum marinum]